MYNIRLGVRNCGARWADFIWLRIGTGVSVALEHRGHYNVENLLTGSTTAVFLRMGLLNAVDVFSLHFSVCTLISIYFYSWGREIVLWNFGLTRSIVCHPG